MCHCIWEAKEKDRDDITAKTCKVKYMPFHQFLSVDTSTKAGLKQFEFVVQFLSVVLRH